MYFAYDDVDDMRDDARNMQQQQQWMHLFSLPKVVSIASAPLQHSV